MVWEDVLRRSAELTRYRRPPIGPEMDGFCHWLHEQGYSRSVVRSHIARVARFNHSLRSRGSPHAQEVRELPVDRFMARHPRQRARRSARHTAPALRGVMGYLAGWGVVTPAVEPPLPYQGLLEGYLDYLRWDRCLGDGPIRSYRHSLTPFLQSLDATAILRSLSEVSPQAVHGFFVRPAQGKADPTRGQIQAALRSLFTFCATPGYGAGHLTDSVPQVFRYRLAHVPRPRCDQEAQRLLERIDRSTPGGRRDYAVVLGLRTSGVRGAPIRALRRQAIHWRHRRIRFLSGKGGEELLDPLTDAVGDSLLDALRDGRPNAADPAVFLTARAPFHPLQADPLYRMIASRLRRRGLRQAAAGPHAFRHGFATRLLNSGHPLKTIAAMLGHRHIDSTCISAQVDFDPRRHLPLDWPEV